MSVDPFILIDKDYSDSVTTAIVKHEQAVSSLNSQLEIDLGSTNDPDVRSSLLSQFDIDVQPARDEYKTAIAKAEETREQAKQSIASTRDAQIEADKQAAKSQLDALAAKLQAGTATPSEVQTAVALALKS